MKAIYYRLIFMLFVTPLSYGQLSYTYTEPQKLSDGWETNNLSALEVDTTLVSKLFDQLRTREHKLHSALLVKNNQILIEEYFDSNSTSTQHDLRSATKSIISILMGIAIDKGFVGNVNDPISKYIKSPVPHKNLDPRKTEITIEHLLTMSTGLDCDDWDKKSKGQEDKVYKKADWLQYTLDLPMINEPGRVSKYCSMGVVLAAEVISQASGMTLDVFADQYLFGPLGITNVSWGHTSKGEIIPAAKRLYMIPRDMAKIGQLILNGGQWNGQQLVSEAWLAEATSEKTKITGLDYGYLWWNIPMKYKGKEIVSTVATGNGGQYIMLFPEHEMLAVFTGGAYNSQEDKMPFAIMTDIFLPTFME